MRRKFLSLTGAAIISALTLSSGQSAALARAYQHHESWHHAMRYDYRDHDRDHGRHDGHDRYHHDHDRR